LNPRSVLYGSEEEDEGRRLGDDSICRNAIETLLIVVVLLFIIVIFIRTSGTTTTTKTVITITEHRQSRRTDGH
jgi:hypothetical protein